MHKFCFGKLSNMVKTETYTNGRVCKTLENLTTMRVKHIIEVSVAYTDTVSHQPGHGGSKDIMNIVLNRIDERLIHGQVLISWAKKLAVRQIVIADDQSAEDPLAKTVLALSVPMGIELKILRCSDALDYLNAQPAGSYPNTILLMRSPQAMKYLWDNGYRLDSINIGGMAAGASRSLLCRGVYMSEEERRILRQLQNEGAEVYVQVVYAEAKTPLSKYL